MSRMKFLGFSRYVPGLLAIAAMPIWPQIYNDDYKRTVVYLVPDGWNMVDYEYQSAYLGPSALPAGLNTDNILSAHLQVRGDFVNGYSQISTSMVRLSTTPSTKNYGGLFHLTCSNYPQCDVNMNSGDAILPSFYKDARFSSTANPRIYVKLDYLTYGTTPLPQTVNNYYLPIGVWDMALTTTGKELPVSLPSLNINNIAAISATIHSDPDLGGKILVNNFERRGYTLATLNGKTLERGGAIDVVPASNPASGSTAKLRIPYLTNNVQGSDNLGTMFKDGRHSLTNANRGWVKVTYAGTGSLSQPYAIKSRIVALGPWAIFSGSAQDREHTLAFNTFGVSGNRIVHAEAVIHGDRVPGSSDNPHILTNLMRNAWGAMAATNSDHGLFYMDEATNTIRMFATAMSTPVYQSYYSYQHQSATDNRGWFTVDYLAGSCSQGGSGFLLKAIPSNKTNNCAGTGNLVIDGAGADIWGNADEFTYVYKSFNSNNRTFQAKVVSQGNSNAWAKTGVMVRLGTSAGSPHVSMMVTPGGGVQFTKRGGNDQATFHVGTTATSVTAPVMLRIVKTRNTMNNTDNYTGWYSKNDGASWTQVGGSTTLPTSSNYLAGVAATSVSPNMNKSTLSNLQF